MLKNHYRSNHAIHHQVTYTFPHQDNQFPSPKALEDTGLFYLSHLLHSFHHHAYSQSTSPLIFYAVCTCIVSYSCPTMPQCSNVITAFISLIYYPVVLRMAKTFSITLGIVCSQIQIYLNTQVTSHVARQTIFYQLFPHFHHIPLSIASRAQFLI